MQILITGLSGFVGQALGRYLLDRDYSIVGLSSGIYPLPRDLIDRVLWLESNSQDLELRIDAALHNSNVVIHLAAMVHQSAKLNEETARLRAEYQRINTLNTLTLASKAAKAGVKRFIYLSSIKVNGEETALGFPFKNSDIPNPQGAYAISKWEAEQGLKKIAATSGMELVIIRPPLVYGKNVKANMAALIRIARLGVPLPFASLGMNKRSLISLDNLISFIELCIHGDGLRNETFLVSDNDDLSTMEIIGLLRKSCGVPSNLFSFSPWLLKKILRIIGKKEVADRLMQNLQIDLSETFAAIDWQPLESPQEGFKKMFSDNHHD